LARKSLSSIPTPKAAEVKELSANTNPNLFIEVDGGVDITKYRQIIEAGANVLVAGNSVFSAADQPLATISRPKAIVKLLQYVIIYEPLGLQWYLQSKAFALIQLSMFFKNCKK
jgi:calcineurin-like phosphoesterase